MSKAPSLTRAAYGAARVSAPRIAIARAVERHAHRAFSVDDLAADVRAHDPGIGLATVYRALQDPVAQAPSAPPA